MKAIFKLCVVGVLLALLPGCGALKGMERSYGVYYQTPEGQRAGAAVTFRPASQSGKAVRPVQPVEALPVPP